MKAMSMSRPRTWTAALIASALLLTAVAACRAEPQTAPAAGAERADSTEPASEAKRWLEKLETRGKQIDSLQARVIYEKLNQLLSDRQTRIGEIAYRAADPQQDRPARFAVHFNQLIVNDALRQRNLTWIFDGSWLVEKQVNDNGRKLFIKRQVVPPGERMNPLSLDGPFPVPIGQSSEQVLARFNVQLIEPNADENTLPHELDAPPLHLRLTPREHAPNRNADAADQPPETATQEQFDRVDLWFNRETLLPLRARTEDGEQRTTITLTNTRVNQLDRERANDLFDTTPPPRGSGWEVEIKPWQE